MIKEYFPVKVGSGNKIHAGIITRTDYPIIAGKKREVHTYTHICGAGNSTHFHNWHKANAKLLPLYSLDDVNCERCLHIMVESND